MKNFILFILLLLVGHPSFSQEIVWQKLAPCEKDSYPDLIYSNRLINKKIVNDTLNIKIGLVRNCSFESKIELVSNRDSLILDIQNISEVFTACLCYFELDIKIVGIRDSNYTLYHNYQITKLNKNGFKKSTEIRKFKYFNSKYIFPTPEEINSTIISNQFYQDSLKTGLWNYKINGTTKLKAKVYYFIGSNGKSKIKWHIKYDKAGEIEEICTNIEIGLLEATTNCIDYHEYLDLIKTKP